MMKRFMPCLAIGVCMLLPAAGIALAADPHTGGSTGQPSQTCLSSTAPTEPGNAASARGSAFNEPNPATGSSGGIAGGVYAGNGQSATSSNSSHSVAQYDVACFQVSNHNQIP